MSGLREGGLDDGINLRWIGRLGCSGAADDLLMVFRDDEDSRGMGQIDMEAEVIVCLYCPGKRAVRVHHEWHLLSVTLEPDPGEVLQVVLIGERRLRFEDVTAVLVRER